MGLRPQILRAGRGTPRYAIASTCFVYGLCVCVCVCVCVCMCVCMCVWMIVCIIVLVLVAIIRLMMYCSDTVCTTYRGTYVLTVWLWLQFMQCCHYGTLVLMSNVTIDKLKRKATASCPALQLYPVTVRFP
jgi:hypothetical protein